MTLVVIKFFGQTFVRCVYGEMKKIKKSPGRPRGAKSQYLKVAERLRAKIASSDWKPGFVLPSIRDLASELQVNRTVVGNALNQLKAEGQIQSTSNRTLTISNAHKNASPLANTILEVCNIPLSKMLNSLDTQQLHKGIQIEISQFSSSLLIASAYEYREDIPGPFLSLPLRGAIVVGPCKPVVLRKYEALRLPVVLLDQPGIGLKISSVSVDNETAAFDATNHLIALNHKRIAFQRQILTFHRDVDPDSKERQKGFERAIRAAGLPFKGDMIINRFRDENPNSPGVQALLNRKPTFTAILCADGDGASIVMQAARSRGISVPADLSIAAFTAKGYRPFIGGPKIDFEAMGRKGASLLEPRSKEIRHVRCTATWEQGETVGRPN